MGEEEKKPEKAEEEAKPSAGDEKKEEESKDPLPPPPPQEVVLRVFMHCEGCARKVRRCLKGFEGIEDVITDCTTHKVTVKGEKADPLKVLERLQKKSHRKVELISPVPTPPAEEPKKPEQEEATPKPEEKKDEVPPPVITVVLKVHMHCEACAQEIRKRILRMKGNLVILNFFRKYLTYKILFTYFNVVLSGVRLKILL
ncbi:putative heavy metal-associated isoprenylated plant protein/8/17/18/19 [Helianthus annuus]|nr:putative heavy metal-associated isoprenylated plant protein/8/17/18/19 [Helianthus annuus]